MTGTATALSTGQWTDGYDGEFRIVVLDECPTCKVRTAHAMETRDGAIECLVCLKPVRIATPPDATFLEPQMPIKITSYADHQAHTRATCTKCTPGYDCDERMRLYTAMSRDLGACRTPYVARTIRKFSTGYVEIRDRGCWTLKAAVATASVQGGEVVDQTHLYTI